MVQTVKRLAQTEQEQAGFKLMILLVIDPKMKEDQRFDRHDEAIITAGQWTLLDRGFAHHTSTPRSRFKHQSFWYKGRLFIHGGTTIPSTEMTDDPLDLFVFDPESTSNDKWERLKTKCSNNKEIEFMSGHVGVVNGNKWYVYGGSLGENKSSSSLWRLNLDNLEWVKLDQKGQVPSSRQCASLFFFEKNWLLLFGGLNCTDVEVYNTFHFYNIDTKNWSGCQGIYMHQLYARLDPALISHNDKIYIFGGTYRNADNEQKYLNDMYEITVNTPGRNLAGKIQLRRLISPLMPESRSGHSFAVINQNFLLLMGGENSVMQLKEGVRSDDVSLVPNAWVYNISKNIWNKIQFSNPNFRYRTMFSCVSGDDKIFIFGGLLHYSQVLNDLVQINFRPEQLNNYEYLQPPCLKCQQKQLYNFESQYYSVEMIEDLASNIEFPFAAFGLLIDNAFNASASQMNIIYHDSLGSSKFKILRFEDDARYNWTEQEFIATMSSFDSGFTSIPTGLDKKTKTLLLRDSQRRELGYNIKLASLRLGESFLYISQTEQDDYFRVCLFEKEAVGTSRERYVLSYYCYSVASNDVTQLDMIDTRNKIENRFGDYIKDALNRRNILNTLLIFNPSITDIKLDYSKGVQSEMKVHYSQNDIINGSQANYNLLQRGGYNVLDCVDISLRAYISSLYLKNQTTKICLSVKNIEPQTIQPQNCLERVDRLCKYKYVLEINQVLQFEFKIVELYYLYDLKKKLGYFSNGLLIYHKNRLITRFNYKLGELLSRKIHKVEGNHNLVRLFGFIELPDHIPINIFKTNYLHHIMMEKLFTRLKFINKLFKKNLSQIVVDINLKRNAPHKVSEQELQQDKLDMQDGKGTRRQKRKYNVKKKSNGQDDDGKNGGQRVDAEPIAERTREIRGPKTVNKSHVNGQSIINSKVTNNKFVRLIEKQSSKVASQPIMPQKKENSYEAKNNIEVQMQQESSSDSQIEQMVNESQEKDNYCINSFIKNQNNCMIQERQMDVEDLPKQKQEDYVQQEERQILDDDLPFEGIEEEQNEDNDNVNQQSEEDDEEDLKSKDGLLRSLKKGQQSQRQAVQSQRDSQFQSNTIKSVNPEEKQSKLVQADVAESEKQAQQLADQ